MFRKKPSFFERLTGSVRIDEVDDFDLDEADDHEDERPHKNLRSYMGEDESSFQEESDDYSMAPETPINGELSVDLIETQDSIILRAMVAGIDPDNIDIDVSRDTVTIKGERKEAHSFSDDKYHHQELYWGSFTRTIVLPAEVEVEEAEAKSNHGLLTINLPKIDKFRKTKLKVSKK